LWAPVFWNLCCFGSWMQDGVF